MPQVRCSLNNDKTFGSQTMTKSPFETLSSRRNKPAARQEWVPASEPLHKNAEFMRAVVAAEVGELRDLFPQGFPNNRLLERITAQDRMGRTALHWLAAQGHAKCVNMIMKRLKTEDDPIITDHDGRTAIHEAVIQNNEAVLDGLLNHESGFRAINRSDRYKRTALHWAAHGGRVDILKKLIDKGADLERTEKCDQTALRVATQKQDSESKWIILLALIAEGAGNEVIEELIRKDQIRPDETGRENETLLHHAVKKGHRAVTRTLVQIGSFDLNAMDRDGSTPLAYACQSGDEAMAELLLDAGANPNARYVQYGKILVKAAGSANVAIVNRLIGAKAEVDARDPAGGTALSLAAFKGYVDVVKALIESGANINVKDAQGSSPLSMAANEGHGPVVKLLLESHAEVDTKDKQGRSPLSYAAGSGSKDCVDLLLDGGAVVGMEDESGTTPLLWAIRNGHRVITEVLLQREDHYNAEQLPTADHEDENDSEITPILERQIAPNSRSDDDKVWGWSGWLADRDEQDNRGKRGRTILPISFKMTRLSPVTSRLDFSYHTPGVRRSGRHETQDRVRYL